MIAVAIMVIVGAYLGAHIIAYVAGVPVAQVGQVVGFLFGLALLLSGLVAAGIALEDRRRRR